MPGVKFVPRQNFLVATGNQATIPTLRLMRDVIVLLDILMAICCDSTFMRFHAVNLINHLFEGKKN
jgi:hypothetical protein